MAIDRRAFLRLALAAGGLTVTPVNAQPGAERQRLYACRTDRTGAHFCSAVSADGTTLFDVQLPARGHGLALSPSADQVVVFARRPGNFFWLLDAEHGQVIARVTSQPDRHFYGHGVFSADGTRLFTSENAFESGEGRIGVYAVDQGFARIAEWASQGVGPHQIDLLADGTSLVVANGGIKTHPDFPRTKLNLPEMAPNLAYLSAQNGKLLKRFEPSKRFHQLSMRHLAIHGQQVALVMQYQGAGKDQPPLIALHRGEEADELRFLTAPAAIQKRLKNYCGSVVWDRSGQIFAVSAPTGGLITFWSNQGVYLDAFELPDGCGLAAGSRAGEFWLSSGHGRLLDYRMANKVAPILEKPDWAWDNHLLSANTSFKESA